MSDTLKLHIADAVARITFNRPDRYNAFDDEMSFAFIDALKAVNKDPAVRVVVLTGEGKAFCSGQDLKAVKDAVSGEAGAPPRDLGESVAKRYNPMMKAIYTSPKPFVCRLNGVAAGAGAGVALACDVVIASEASSLLMAFAKIGLVPDSGISYILPRLVGARRAFDMAALPETISADEALRLGMVNRVVPAADLDAATDQVVQRLAAAPTKAVGYIKKMLYASSTNTLDAQLEAEMQYQQLAGYTDDYREGVAAFNEKRPATFTGK
jgi:2-(1,2-epoxy-1,2-dihydrophenyl)acetyl-CoA isomerase